MKLLLFKSPSQIVRKRNFSAEKGLIAENRRAHALRQADAPNGRSVGSKDGCIEKARIVSLRNFAARGDRCATEVLKTGKITRQ